MLLALIVALVLRFHAPPEVARLLPESDAILYFNLKPVRAASHFDEQPVNASPDYAHFLDATGFRWDRDLDRIAVSLHRMPDPNGPNGVVAYTGVAEGRFDATKLTAFLKSNSVSVENYAGHDVYTIPGNEGRTLRVSALGYDMVAASNMPMPEQIHSVIDRYAAGASPFAGSSLLSLRYPQVPYFALAWGIGHVGLPFSDRGSIQVFGVTLPLSEDTDFIASVSFRGSLHLRLEELATNESQAQQTAANLTTIVNLVRGFTPATGTPQDVALHQTFESLTVEQKKSRVVLSANLSPTLLSSAAKSK
ncbi:hypothetical protein SAMN05443244_1250 [Terriglobus roseus]|uniref:Uncharacterized protein n=1 Tax=Terriglobus roseus TaxID=392734 RepID=A0A1H4KMU4_9BACT|nr:hypothetical protein SAMN05443244_1250 [Terriglobus roseus]